MLDFILFTAGTYCGLGLVGALILIVGARPRATFVEWIGAMLIVVLWPVVVVAMFHEELRK